MNTYPEEMVAPMRHELVEVGFEELRSPEEVDEFLGRGGTSVLFVNSVCGCSAAVARPAMRKALQMVQNKPDHLGTVFAGVDIEATARAREYMLPYPPSSPSIAFFRDGMLRAFIERHEIVACDSDEELAQRIASILEELCE